MLPVIAGNAETSKQIWWYTLLMLPATFLLVYPLGVCGAFYAGIAAYLGFIFGQKAWQLLQKPDDRDTARALFKYSIFYLMLLCAAMVVDSLPITHHLTQIVADNLQTVIAAIL
jgi:heme o synthase